MTRIAYDACVRARRHQPLDMLSDRRMVFDAHAQDLHAVAACAIPGSHASPTTT